MRSSLHKIAAILDPEWDPESDLDSLAWGKLRRDDTQRVRRELVRTYKPRSANRMLSALRQVLRRCWQDAQLTYDEYKLTADIKPLAVHEASEGHALHTAMIEKLVLAADTGDVVGARDAALIATMYAAGLRKIEAHRTDISSYNRETHDLKVTGKGGRIREIPLIPGWSRHLEHWLSIAPSVGPLFPRIRRRERITTARMSVDDIGTMIDAVRIRTPGCERFTPHDLRRSFGTHLLDNGVDIALVKQLMGHASIQTTTIYDKRGIVSRRRAVAVISRDDSK